jgi:alpha-1,3-glucan synthase
VDTLSLDNSKGAVLTCPSYLQIKVGDWPVYTFLLAFAQIIAANSYQINLLTGTVGQSAEKLYIVAAIYLVTSIMWWLVFRYFKSIWVLSLPFLFYGFAFLFLGCAPLLHSISGTGWMQNVATGCYATASSSGSIYFALNFGDEGGSPVKDWVYRACVIQGTQQIYVVALWFWGSRLANSTAAGVVTTNSSVASTWKMTAISVPIALLMWTIGIILFIGLPDFYRQAPGAVPSFYKSLGRRNIILWFFVSVVVQNYFLSAPYGRNWSYLFSSRHAPAWAVAVLVLFFFIVLWALLLWIFSILSMSHSWILPIFAIGLGAPRWCQMLWGTSNIGLFLPWAQSPIAGALLGRALWLWLGLLDTVQGVGLGMILLQTLTRIHVAFTLIAAQVLGSVATILARATAPNKVGPGDVFPDFSAGVLDGVSTPWFWVAMLAQIGVCLGFFAFFRKEQLSKP